METGNEASDLADLSNLLDCEVLNEDDEQDKKLCGRTSSEVHADHDSADDDCDTYFINKTPTENGHATKNIAIKVSSENRENQVLNSKRSLSTPNHTSALAKPLLKNASKDPFFGIRIINPLVSSQVLEKKMNERTHVPFNRLQNYLGTNDGSSDWVLAGAIVSKINTTSKKGNVYLCWTLSDLKGDLTTVSLYLFGSAYKKFWTTSTHTVVAVLNATPLEKKGTEKAVATLSVWNSDQVMLLGLSKDLGTCKALKTNGSPCTSFVNKNICEFCVYHVKKEYNRFTGRSELQSSNSLVQLRNKVLGKQEVFYGGKAFRAKPAKVSRKQSLKDINHLSKLFKGCESRFGPESSSHNVRKSQTVSSRVLLMKDAEQLQKRTGIPATITSLVLKGQGQEIPTAKEIPLDANPYKTKDDTSEYNNSKIEKGLVLFQDNTPVIKKERIGENKVQNKQPTKNRFTNLINLKDVTSLGNIAEKNKLIEMPQLPNKIDTYKATQIKYNNQLSKHQSEKRVKDLVHTNSPKLDKFASLTVALPLHSSKAKANALKYVKQKGPIKKDDPNTKKHKPILSLEKKRKREDEEGDQTLLKGKFLELMNTTSSHPDLVSNAMNQAQDEYYEKMEKKEKMEEKMLSTYQIECKAFKCLKCNYKCFGISELCKAEKHPIKMIKSMKRFFECSNCKNRIVCLDIIPTKNCSKCGDAKWIKTPMMREKKFDTHELSIRGDEGKFLNCTERNTNLNLLVPDNC